MSVVIGRSKSVNFSARVSSPPKRPLPTLPIKNVNYNNIAISTGNNIEFIETIPITEITSSSESSKSSILPSGASDCNYNIKRNNDDDDDESDNKNTKHRKRITRRKAAPLKALPDLPKGYQRWKTAPNPSNVTIKPKIKTNNINNNDKITKYNKNKNKNKNNNNNLNNRNRRNKAFELGAQDVVLVSHPTRPLPKTPKRSKPKQYHQQSKENNIGDEIDSVRLISNSVCNNSGQNSNSSNNGGNYYSSHFQSKSQWIPLNLSSIKDITKEMSSSNNNNNDNIQGKNESSNHVNDDEMERGRTISQLVIKPPQLDSINLDKSGNVCSINTPPIMIEPSRTGLKSVFKTRAWEDSPLKRSKSHDVPGSPADDIDNDDYNIDDDDEERRPERSVSLVLPLASSKPLTWMINTNQRQSNFFKNSLSLHGDIGMNDDDETSVEKRRKMLRMKKMTV